MRNLCFWLSTKLRNSSLAWPLASWAKLARKNTLAKPHMLNTGISVTKKINVGAVTF